ncbi:solute carrier family 2, facilitated glucose transporter member 3-like [Rhopalosiphum maidis]|uniref:solute carrier family 2, facilitated glucose transporter member 3-like n=1 Tax=Rhopalosiphum maidis TaxID=43146 RepID=UPI000EFDE49D|nr:solute carrier family 2, facilitated glucose transporter member 3-like [Rhopalosiphum maidis]
MESSTNIRAFTVLSVAMAIGIIIRQMEWSSLIPQPESQIFPSSISGADLWCSLSPIFFVAGAVIGALLSGPVWRCFDSRLSMAFFDTVLIGGLSIVTLPVTSTELMVASRLLLGIGSGAMSAIVPAYVGEISHPKFRGRMGILFYAVMVMGIVISDVFGSFKQYDIHQPFSIPFNVYCSLFIKLHSIGLCFVPKLPYSTSNNFLEPNHSNDESLSTINLLGEPFRMDVLHSMVSMFSDYHNTYRRSSWHILDAFSCRADRKALLIGVGCMFFHQMCGINVMISYMFPVMKMADIDVDPKMVSIAMGIVQVIMMLVAIFIIDSKGRRMLLIYSAVIMCLCLVGLAFCIIIKMQLNATTFNDISMILIMFFIMAYSLGFGPVPWVILGEIFSTKVKSYGISFATAINWLLVLASAYFPYEMNKFFEIEYIFLFYFVLCLCGALFVWRFLPETKQFSLIDVQRQLDIDYEHINYIPAV